MCLFFLCRRNFFVQQDYLRKEVLHKIFDAMHRSQQDCLLTMVSVQHTMRFIKLLRFGAIPIES
jgi:hypothetical protein